MSAIVQNIRLMEILGRRRPNPPQKPDRNAQTLLDGVRVELIEPKDKAKWNLWVYRPSLSRTSAEWADRQQSTAS
jgi:hypothetical protein